MRLTAGMLRRIIKEEVALVQRSRRGLRESPFRQGTPQIPDDYVPRNDSHINAGEALTKAVEEFVSNQDPHMTDLDIEHTAYDIADNFFHEYSEWKTWAQKLGTTKGQIRSMIMDRLSEVM